MSEQEKHIADQLRDNLKRLDGRPKILEPSTDVLSVLLELVRNQQKQIDKMANLLEESQEFYQEFIKERI